jgi:hypothetical protein
MRTQIVFRPMQKGGKWRTLFGASKIPLEGPFPPLKVWLSGDKAFSEPIFKADERVSIDAIVRLALFSQVLSMRKITRPSWMRSSEDELKAVLHNFQKDKSPGPDGWTIDFFVGIYNIIGKDILKVVEESRINGHIHAPLNATFIALIPKKDDP